MALYLVSIPEHDYDEYDAFVVRAEDHAHAQQMAYEASHKQEAFLHKAAVVPIKSTGDDEIILGSFNAG